MGLLCSLTDSGVKQGLQVPLSSPPPVSGILIPSSYRQTLPLGGRHTSGSFRLTSVTLHKLRESEEREIIFLLYGYT